MLYGGAERDRRREPADGESLAQLEPIGPGGDGGARSGGVLDGDLERGVAGQSLTLTFADSPLLLTGIEMVDAAGHDTRLRFSSQRRPDALDPSLFDTATA